MGGNPFHSTVPLEDLKLADASKPPAAPRPQGRGPAPSEPEPHLSPTIRRFTVKETEYTRFLFIDRVRKFAVLTPASNTVDIDIATAAIAAADTEAHDTIEPGDARLWEATRPGEQLSMNVFARVASGSATLVIWSWK